jgi:serine/threonine protein kinase
MLKFLNDPIETIKSTFGTIYVFKSENGSQFVLKKYNSKLNHAIYNEYILMKGLSQYNAITDIVASTNHGIVLPYYKHDCSSLNPNLSSIRKSLHQLLQIVDILSSEGIYHRDFKPNNIMIDEKGYLKVIDFGLSCYRHAILDHTKVTTLWYQAPEVLNNKPYTRKSELWSIGCIIAQQILGEPLFKENCIDRLLDKIQQFEQFRHRFDKEIQVISIDQYNPHWPFLKRLKTIYKLSPEIYRIVTNLLEIQPNRRHSARKWLQDPIFPHDSKPLINRQPEDFTTENLLEISKFAITQRIVGAKASESSYSDRSLYQLYEELTPDNYQSLAIGISNGKSFHIQEFIRGIDQSHHLIDVSFDLIVQSLYLYTQFLSLETPVLKNYDNMTIFKVFYIITNEVFNDYFTRSEYLSILGQELENYDQICQTVLNVSQFNPKQDRKLYHSASNIASFRKYNMMYNLIYLVNCSISYYNYNYTIWYLQRIMRGKKPRIDGSSSKTTDYLLEIIDKFFIDGWVLLKTYLINLGLPLENINKFKHCYKRCRRRYLKNKSGISL